MAARFLLRAGRMLTVERFFAALLLLLLAGACGSGDDIGADAQPSLDAGIGDAQVVLDADVASSADQLAFWSNPGVERVEDLALDSESRSFLLGKYSESISFGTVQHDVSLPGAEEIWAASLAPDGTALWSVAIHKDFDTLSDRAYSIVPDGDGGAWILANLFGSVEVAGQAISIASNKRRLVLLHLDAAGHLKSHIESEEMSSNIGGGSHYLIRSGDTLYLAAYLIGENLFTPFAFAGLTLEQHGNYLIAIDALTGQGKWHRRLEGYNESIAELQINASGELLAIGANDYALKYGTLELPNTKAGQPYVLTIAASTGDALDGWFVPSCDTCRSFSEYVKSAVLGSQVAVGYYEFDGGIGYPVVALFSKSGTLAWRTTGDPQVTLEGLATSDDRVFAVGMSTIPFHVGGESATIAGPVLVEIEASTGAVSCLRVAPILDRDQGQTPVEDIDPWAAVVVANGRAHVAGAMRGPLWIDGAPVSTEGVNDIVRATYAIGAAGSSWCP